MIYLEIFRNGELQVGAVPRQPYDHSDVLCPFRSIRDIQSVSNGDAFEK